MGELGKDISHLQFSADDSLAFRQKLGQNLEALKLLLHNPQFGVGRTSFGAELELYIIDEHARVLPINQLLHTQYNDPQLTLELNQFNLEYNFTPVAASGSPFTQIKQEMQRVLSELSALTAQQNGRVIPVGILPTLEPANMGEAAITDIPRYHVLDHALRQMRGGNFVIDIDGAEPIKLECEDVSLEGANTSFQFHYRVDPAEFVDAYNAAQLVTPLVVALGANSPLFYGHKLWQETRIALFQQSIDYRIDGDLSEHLPARVMFGMGWLKESVYDLFAQGVFLFDPILPEVGDERPEDVVKAGGVPSLEELRLHQGTIWNWNRPVYDPADGGHFRIELRALPAGPSVPNMVANVALMSGLIKGLQPHINDYLVGMPFKYARQNFYRAAKYGLDATIFWPCMQSHKLEEKPLCEVLAGLLETAESGLKELDVSESDVSENMAVVRAGLDQKMNGARWQLEKLDALLRSQSRTEAMPQLVEAYYSNFMTGKPVHEWR